MNITSKCLFNNLIGHMSLTIRNFHFALHSSQMCLALKNASPCHSRSIAARKARVNRYIRLRLARGCPLPTAYQRVGSRARHTLKCFAELEKKTENSKEPTKEDIVTVVNSNGDVASETVHTKKKK